VSKRLEQGAFKRPPITDGVMRLSAAQLAAQDRQLSSVQERVEGIALTNTSDRQIAANRRNARRSTGPRSRGGKQRAGRNSFRHGLSISSSASCAAEAERLAREIAGDTNNNNSIILERARAVAYAELDLARVQRAKIALIERNRAIPRNI
jgi:hypothetical protein